MKKYRAYILIFVIFILFLIFGRYLSSHNYYEQNLEYKYLKPFTNGYILGTDSLGRSIYQRLLKATATSFVIAIIVSIISSSIGLIYGSISAFFKYDYLMTKIITIINSIPHTIYLVLILMFFKTNIFSIIIALSVTEWISYALLIRANTKKIMKSEYIVSSYIMGANFKYILKKHLIKNNLKIILTKISLDIPSIIFAESFLSFVGLGVKIPNTSLGSLVFDGMKEFYFSPYPFIFPTIMIFLISIYFHLLSKKIGGLNLEQNIGN